MDEINDIKSRKRRLSEIVESLEKEADKLSTTAGTKASVELFTKAHALRQQAKKNKQEICDLECDLQAKILKLASC